MNINHRHVDLSYLKDMSGGNREVMLEMIELFNSQVPELIEKMKHQLQQKNIDELSRLAHKAKASAHIMGMEEAAAKLKSLEYSAKESRDGENFSLIIKDLEKQFSFAIEELKNIAATL